MEFLVQKWDVCNSYLLFFIEDILLMIDLTHKEQVRLVFDEM